MHRQDKQDVFEWFADYLTIILLGLAFLVAMYNAFIDNDTDIDLSEAYQNDKPYKQRN